MNGEVKERNGRGETAGPACLERGYGGFVQADELNLVEENVTRSPFVLCRRRSW